MQTSTASATAIPGSYISGSNVTASNTGNFLTNSSSTTYATFTLTRSTSPQIIYGILVTGIPSGATIKSVSCVVKCRVSNTTRASTANVGLYSGTTLKSNTASFKSTSTSYTVTLTGSNISTNDLANLRLQFDLVRNSTNTATYAYLYGASLTIQYETTVYKAIVTIVNGTVSANYQLNTDVIPQGSSLTLTITPTAPNDFRGMIVNGSMVTPTKSGSNYTYTISSVTTDYTISITLNVIVRLQIDGAFKNAQQVYKKVNGSWVLQDANSYASVFNGITSLKKG